ncbi:MAG: glycosyltransferase family 2 protein [Roseivirga sp.]|nr:glycosyltransferase family 2 protein [Roseivirga sp.]
MTVVISILNWNSMSRTRACLESLKVLKEYPDLVVCVTDNNSLRFDSQVLESEYPDLVIFKNPENLGFAGGQAKALEYAKSIGTALFWMLNNDTRVFPNTLTHLLKAYQTHGNGVYGSAALDKEGAMSTELIWELAENNFKTKFIPLSQEQLSQGKTFRVANVVGYSLLLPVTVIEEHGFMDPSYFLYYEETDYCLRLLNHGVPSYWVGSSKVYHEKEGSSQGKSGLKEIMEYYLYRNLFIFLRRYGSVRMNFHYLGRFGMRFISANVARRQKVPPLTGKHLLGIFHAFAGKRGPYYRPEDYL